jgi:hypothetical protein
MKTAVMVLNPRDIPYCMDALRNLGHPTCFISYVPEPEAAERINHEIAATNFDRYTIISDDCEPTREALELVLGLHDQYPELCVTGYCNFDKELPWVNLCTNRLRPPPPFMDSYRFVRREEVDAEGTAVIQTSFTGLSFTTMTRELWLRFPLSVTRFGGQMDYQLSWELQSAGVSIVAPRGAFVHHHKDKFGVYPDASPEKQLYVGIREPAVTWINVPLDSFGRYPHEILMEEGT